MFHENQMFHEKKLTNNSLNNKKRTKKINKFLQFAKKEAEKSSLYRKHGSVIIKNGKVISSGFNKSFTHKRFGRYSIHAEIDCLNNCSPSVLKGADIYTVRIDTQSDGYMISAPCHSCYVTILKYMKEYDLRYCYFTNFQVQNIVYFILCCFVYLIL